MPGTLPGTGTWGGANVEGGAGRHQTDGKSGSGRPQELGGPARGRGLHGRTAGALYAGSGVQPRGSAGWTRGRGAERMAVQVE